MKKLKITNQDFYNYYLSLSNNDRKNLIGMKISTGINGDSYKSRIVDIKRNGKTIITEWLSGGNIQTYTYKKSAYYGFRYSLKGYRFGSINFNKCESHRVREY